MAFGCAFGCDFPQMDTSLKMWPAATFEDEHVKNPSKSEKSILIVNSINSESCEYMTITGNWGKCFSAEWWWQRQVTSKNCLKKGRLDVRKFVFSNRMVDYMWNSIWSVQH